MSPELKDVIMLGTFVMTALATSWKLHSEMTAIKLTLQELLTRFMMVDKIESRVDRLEKKVFHIDSAHVDAPLINDKVA